jgi:hypothetical protein
MHSARQVEEYTGVGPLLESGEPWNDQRDSAEQFPDSQDDQQIERIAQPFDETANLRHSSDVPYAPKASSKTTRTVVTQ